VLLFNEPASCFEGKERFIVIGVKKRRRPMNKKLAGLGKEKFLRRTIWIGGTLHSDLSGPYDLKGYSLVLRLDTVTVIA
jgi:hypothetical protein